MSSKSLNNYEIPNVLPQLIVFDLDMCLWRPETYTLDVIPDDSCKIIGKLGRANVEGVIGVKSGYEQIRLFPGALLALQDFISGKLKSGNTRLAIASSADTPRAVQIAQRALNLLEVLPGITVSQAFSIGWNEGFTGNIQIGRSSPLSSNKAVTHFPIIRKETGIEYNKMLYFDDCTWDDHCANVELKCPGVVTLRTPNGLQESDWILALKKFDSKYSLIG
eukprot:gene19468-25350_t